MIPKTVNPVRVTENLKSTELKLDAEDMRRLRDINKDFRLFHVSSKVNYSNLTDDMITPLLVDYLCVSVTCLYMYLQGKTFLPASITCEQAWDVEADEKFEIK